MIKLFEKKTVAAPVVKKTGTGQRRKKKNASNPDGGGYECRQNFAGSARGISVNSVT
jgi:hypothetical protein